MGGWVLTEGGRFLNSVQDFSVKRVFTEENTTALAGRWVKVEKGRKGGECGGGEKGGEGGRGGGVVVSNR